MLDDFFWRAMLGGMGVAAAAGPLGCFVVWRRMAMFGEALANAALLGIALAVLLEVDMLMGAAAVIGVLALGLLLVERSTALPVDTLLSICSHGALAIGLLVVSSMDRLRVDLLSFLFGDILAVSRGDLIVIAVLALVVLATVIWLWRPLLSATVQEDVAAVEGVRVVPLRLVVTLLLAALIAVGIKIVGMLLIVALLVIPAATARQMARTPEEMAGLAGALGIASVAMGLWLSLTFDWPSGPAIVATAILVFTATGGAMAVVRRG